MDFHSMKRKELQGLCKNHGIPANLSNVEMANRLSSIFKGSEKEKPLIRGRSCLKASENDSDGVNREVKKVRFSPENEMIEFTKSIAKRGFRGESRMINSCLIAENKQIAAKSSPVIVTRAQGLHLLNGVTKRGLNGNEKLSSCKEVRVTTRRALRNREMQDEGLRENEGIVEGPKRNSGRQRNRGSAKGIEDVSQSKQFGEEPQDAFRRSKRNAAKNDTGKNENNKQALSELEIDDVTSVENGNKEVGVITRRSLRNREITVEGKKEGLRRSGRQKSNQGPLGNHEGVQSRDIVEEPEKEVRISKRNVINAKQIVMIDEKKNSGKARLGRNQIKREAAQLKIAEDSFASSNVSNGENRACTKRLLRNTKVAVSEDINEGLKNMGGKTSMRKEKSREEGANKQIEEELNKGLRRSKRTAAKMDDSQYLYRGVGKSKMVRKEQKTRSQFAMSVEASILAAMPESEIAALEKNEVGKEPSKATIRSSPQNSVMPLLEKATKDMEASLFGSLSETETADGRRLQVEEPTSISPRSSSFDSQFETEIAALSRLEVVNQVIEQTSASSRRATKQKSGTILLENVRNVHQNMDQNLGYSTSNASLEVEGIKDDEMSEAAVEKESFNKKSTPAETSSQRLRVDATTDDKIVQPVGKDKDAGNKQPLNVSETTNMALGVSLAEDITKISEQCTYVALLSGTTDTETTKEPASTVPLVDESCLEENESEETRQRKNQVSPHNVGDRTGEVEEVKSPQLVSGVEYSCSDLVDLCTDTEVQLVDIPVTVSKGFAEMVKISMEMNVENSLDDLEVANLAEQEPSEDFNVDRDSASTEDNTTIDCYRSNGQLYLTDGVKEMQRKEVKGIDYAESVVKEDEIVGENELVVIAEPLDRVDEKSPATEVSLAEDRMSNGEKKSLEVGDCNQFTLLSCVEVTDFLNEPVNSENFINDTIMNSNKFEELAKQSKQMSSPKVGNREKMEEVNCRNAIKESFSELVTSHTDQVEQETVIGEIKDFPGKVNISLEQNTEKPLGGLVGHDLVHFKRDDVINDDREKEMEEVNSPQLENAVKESFSEHVTSHTDQVEQEKVDDEIKDFSDKVNISVEENTEKSLGGLVGHNLVQCKTYDGINVDRENEIEEGSSPHLENAVKESFSKLVTSHTDHVVQEKVLVGEIKDISDEVYISVEENTEKSLGSLVGHNLVHCKTFDGVNVDREKEIEEVNSPQLENAVKESLPELVSSHTHYVEQDVNELKDFSDKVNISSEENAEMPLGGLVGHNLVQCKAYDGINVVREREMEEVNIPQLENAVKESCSEVVTSHTDHEEQQKVLVDEIKEFSNKVSISLEKNAEKSLGGLLGHNLVLCKTYDGINVDREKEMEEVNSPQLENAVNESFSELVSSHTNHVEQENVLVNELKDFSDKVNISLEENAVKSLGGFVGHNLVHCMTYDGISVDRDTVPLEINSPTKAYGCIYQSDLTADVKEKQTEEVAELQYAGSLSKDIGSTFQSVEHAVKGDLSGEKEPAVNAACSANSIATVIVSDVLQDNLDDRPGEKLEDGSPRFVKSGFIDSTEKHKCDAYILEFDALNAGNAEKIEPADWKKALQLGEQLSSKLRNTTEFVFVERDEILKDEDLENQGIQVVAPDNDGKPSVSDATERISETSPKEVRGSNAEGSVNNVEHEHFPFSESKLQNHGELANDAVTEIHSQRTHSNDLETGRGLCECEDGSDGTEPDAVPGVLDLDSSYCVSPSKCSDDEDQEEQLRLLFSTPIKDGSTCEDNANACYMDSNKTSGQFIDASIAGEEVRKLFMTCGDVSCPDGYYYKCSDQSANTNGLESDRCLFDCECGSDSTKLDYQLRLLFSTPTATRSIGEENANALIMDSNTISGKELMKSFTTSDASTADGKIKCTCQNECIEKFDSLEQEDQFRPKSVRGTEEETGKDLYMDSSNQRCSELIEASNAELEKNDLPENGGDSDIEEISKFAEPLALGAQGNLPCHLSTTPFQEKYEGVETEGNNNCCDEVWEEAAWMSSEAVVVQQVKEKTSGENEGPDSDCCDVSSPSSSLKLNLCFGGNMEEKAQKSEVENICSTSSKCNYYSNKDEIIAANSNNSPSKFHTMEERNECIVQPLVVSQMSQPRSALHAQMATHQSTVQVDSDGDKQGLVEDASLSLEKQNALFSSLAKSILIPYKQHDMKENAPAPKGEIIATLTAAPRPQKRQPLKDLRWKM